MPEIWADFFKKQDMIILDELDKKALDHFRGYVVKKDLVGIIKGGANVPAFVLEYLLANTCSTEDEIKLKEGMENVKTILRNHYINPEESNDIYVIYDVNNPTNAILGKKNDGYFKLLFRKVELLRIIILNIFFLPIGLLGIYVLFKVFFNRNL